MYSIMLKGLRPAAHRHHFRVQRAQLAAGPETAVLRSNRARLLLNQNPDRGSRVANRGARGESLITRHSSLAPLPVSYFILMINPLVPSCSRAPCETERRCKITPSEFRSTMPPMPPARVSPASAAT